MKSFNLEVKMNYCSHNRVGHMMTNNVQLYKCVQSVEICVELVLKLYSHNGIQTICTCTRDCSCMHVCCTYQTSKLVN